MSYIDDIYLEAMQATNDFLSTGLSDMDDEEEVLSDSLSDAIGTIANGPGEDDLYRPTLRVTPNDSPFVDTDTAVESMKQQQEQGIYEQPESITMPEEQGSSLGDIPTVKITDPVTDATSNWKKFEGLDEASGVVSETMSRILKRPSAKMTPEQIQVYSAQVASVASKPLEAMYWPLGRFVEHPVMSLVLDMQERSTFIPNKKAFMRAAKAMKYEKLGTDKATFGEGWEDWYEFQNDGKKAPEWYKAMAGAGTAITLFSGASLLKSGVKTRAMERTVKEGQKLFKQNRTLMSRVARRQGFPNDVADDMSAVMIADGMKNKPGVWNMSEPKSFLTNMKDLHNGLKKVLAQPLKGLRSQRGSIQIGPGDDLFKSLPSTKGGKIVAGISAAKGIIPDTPKPKEAVIKSQSGVAPPPLTKKLKESERFGLPKEAIAELQQAKKKIWESLRPAAIFDKIDSVYDKIAQVKEGATKIGNVVQETTILNAIEKGQEMVARDAFREGKKAGIYAQKDKFSDVVERAKSRKGLSNEVNKIRNQIKKIDVKNMRPEYKDQITSMIDSVDLVNRRGSTIKNLENMRAYIEENPDNIIPATKLAKLSILGKKKIKDLTIEDLRLFRDSVKHLEHLNKLKNKLIFGKKSRELAYVVGEARNNINKKKSMVEIDPSIMNTTVSEPKIGSLKQIFTVDSYNPELITEILDKEKNGIIKDVLYKGTDKGVTEQLRYAQGVHDVITESISGADISNWSEQFNTKATDVDYQTVALPSGKKIKLTKGERISFYLHSFNDKNLKHLLKGGWSYDKSSSIMNVMDDKDLKALITSMTPEEIKVANAMFDQLNTTQKQKLNEVSVELNGIEVATVDSYWPIRTNELDTISRAKKGKNNFTHATIEGMGMLQEKTNASNGIIIEDAFKTFYTSTKKASAYVGLAKPLRDARMLLQDNRFKQSIIQNYGKPYLTSMESYLDAIEDNSHNTENVDKLTTDLINKLDMAILGLNPFVMLKQPVSFVMASTEMDIKYLKKGLRTKTNFDEIKKFSPQLRDRLEGNVSRELGELGQVGEIKRYFTGKSPINNKLMAPIRFGDKVTIGKIWNSVKAEISEKYPKLEGDEYMKAVAERAEEVVRLTQLTSHVKDRSAIGRSKSTTVRLLTKYTSQRNKNYNAIKRSVEEYNRSPKSTKDKSKLFKKLFIITVISSAMIEGINASRDFIYKKDRKSWVERGVNTFGNTIGYAYGGGDAFSSIASKVKYGTFTGWDINNPASSFVNESFDAVAEIIRTIHQVVTQEASKGEAKWKKSSVRAIDKSLQTVLALKGVPYRTLKNLIKAPYKWVTESDNSDNVSEDTDMQDYLDSFSSDNDMQDYLDSYGDD